MQEQSKFDKNQLIGFILIGVILIGFYFYSSNTKQQQKVADNPKTAGTQTPPQEVIAKPQAVTDSAQQQKVQLIPLSNAKLDLKISTQGAQLREIRLKEYTAYDKASKGHKKPLYLVKDNNSDFNISFKDNNGKVYNTRDLVFSPQISGNSITFTSTIANTGSIQFKYSLTNAYSLDFSVISNGLSQISKGDASLEWDQRALALEKGHSQETAYTEFRYSLNNYSETDYDTNGFEEGKDKLDWVSVKQQFFTTILESKNGFSNSVGTQKREDNKDTSYIKDFTFKANVPVKNEINESYTWNFLPLDYYLLSEYKTTDGKSKEFNYNVPFGWTKWLNIFYLWIYKILANFAIPAGWIIAIMTIVVKLVTSPIMYRQFKQSAMMRILKPEIDALNEKNKDADAIKKQQATMALYKKAGVNPLAGCLPALIQIPIFYSLFRFFPNVIDLRGKSFWWADDLTAYDSIFEWNKHIWLVSDFYGNHISLFTLLYCAVLLIYTKMSASSMTQPTQEGMPDMRFIMYLMPVMFIFFLNSYASGLTWYYFVSNAINIVIILAIKNWFINEDKIHHKMQENKTKPVKKKGKFAQKMQELLDKAQEQQQQQQKIRDKYSKKK